MLKTPGLLVSVGLAAVLALLVSCGQGSEPGNNRAEETTGDFGLRPPGTPVIIADPRYATLNGSSVGTLAAAYPWVVVGVVTGARNDPWSRQATVSHELGHAAGLRHDNSAAGEGLNDFKCGEPGYPPRTIMDYDCYFSPEVVNVPQAWDSCGINHAYPDPYWGYSGC